MIIKIGVSFGELIDKITILSIKKNKITDKDKLINIEFEYDYLTAISKKEILFTFDSEYYIQLYTTNEELWNIEDQLRIKERKKEFDFDFIELARKVYTLNDKRAEIKLIINKLYGSTIIEEKSYEKY